MISLKFNSRLPEIWVSKNRILQQLFILILFLFHSNGYSQKVANESIDKGRQVIQDLISKNNIPGLSVSISKDGELIWSEGFGYADLEQKVPVYTNKTKFRIGSVSKPLTAVALALLYEQHKINLDVAIQNYVPTFPVKKDSITLRLLAGHLAGIRHYKKGEFLSNKYYETVEEGLDIFKNDPLINKPGSEFAYSSYGWNLISAAIENAAKEPFLDYMKTHVFDVMQMKKTFADKKSEIIPFRTRFYYVNPEDRKTYNAPSVDNSYKWAGGGFISTSEDLIKFGDALLQNSILKKKTLLEFVNSQQTQNGKKTNYGMGFTSNTDENGKYWFGHSGGSVGGVTQFVIYPEEKLVIAIVTNCSNVKYGSTINELALIFGK